MPELPPWLTRDYDPVGAYQRAFATSAQISMEQQRLAAQQVQAAMEDELRREQMKANILRAQTEMAYTKAYRDQQMALRQSQLEETKKAHQAAAANYERMARQAMLPKIHFGPNGEVLSASPDGRVSVLKGGTPKLGPMDYTTETTEIPAVPAVPDQPAREIPGTWLKGFMGFGSPARTVPAVPGTPASPKKTITKRVPIGRVPVLAPDGKTRGHIPAGDVQEAKDKGFTILNDVGNVYIPGSVSNVDLTEGGITVDSGPVDLNVPDEEEEDYPVPER